MTFDWTQGLSKNSIGSLVGGAVGVTSTLLLSSKGKIKDIPKINFGIKDVICLSVASSTGGLIGGILTDKKNKKAKIIEYGCQLGGNELVPLLMMEATDKFIKVENKVAKSSLLAGVLLAGTFIGHKITERILGKHGLKENYPVESSHLAADVDDFLLPVAIGTNSKILKNILKFVSPITYLPMAHNVGTAKLDKYY